tara:strand:+ start:883 stop:1044 length:162 start_codon:yes stop_codon:yes gene_type:complete
VLSKYLAHEKEYDPNSYDQSNKHGSLINDLCVWLFSVVIKKYGSDARLVVFIG